MPLTEPPSDLPDKFADFFLNKIRKIREQFSNENTQKIYHRKCTSFSAFLSMDREETLNIIKKMNPVTFHHWSLQHLTSVKVQGNNSRCHHHNYKSVITTGKFLHDWKVAAVRPLIKDLNMGTELKNYRPKSNLSFISKIIEKAAQVQLQKHYAKQSLLLNHQSAYTQHYSTETTLLNMCGNILKNMETQKCTSIVCLDLSAAFDTVNHKLLLGIQKS